MIMMMSSLLQMDEIYSMMIIKFFMYSMFGWCLECIVIRNEKGYWENRGFTKLPFCIIYGFGGTLCYNLLSPLSDNIVLLFVVGACLATMFEFCVAKLLIYLFDNVWWNYSNHKFQYKGILCLQSSIGWGVLTLFIVFFLDKFLTKLVFSIPVGMVHRVSIFLLAVYTVDFIHSFYGALQNKGYIGRKEDPSNMLESDTLDKRRG